MTQHHLDGQVRPLVRKKVPPELKKSFVWLSFNKSFPEPLKGHRIAIAINPCFISKLGKKTLRMDSL